MKYIIVGLGNPGSEYEHTRHNTGRMAVEYFDTHKDFGGFISDGKTKSDLSKGKIGSHTVTLMLPNTFMNASGTAVNKLVTSSKAAERVIVVYDDIDLPLGTIRLAYARGSGGHNGIESVIKALKTKNFIRIRIGIAPTTPSGKIKKPKGEKKIYNFLLGDFSKKEDDILRKVYEVAGKAMECAIVSGRSKAMNTFN